MNATAEPEKIAVWLIEDHDDCRRMVARVINQIPGMHCPHVFASCETALAEFDRGSKPRIVLTDVGLPGMNGIDGVREIKARSPGTDVIVLTVYDDHDKVFKAICAGASGYLLKNSSEETIANAIQEVLRGGAPMNPRVARLVLDMFARQNPAPRRDYGLSDREKEILELMVKGLIKKEIADRLSLSYHTVDNHLRNIYSKLHVNTRGGAVAKALQERLLGENDGQPAP
jgi:DNA-binding NarL/FixJ family response regulator